MPTVACSSQRAPQVSSCSPPGCCMSTRTVCLGLRPVCWSARSLSLSQPASTSSAAPPPVGRNVVAPPRRCSCRYRHGTGSLGRYPTTTGIRRQPSETAREQYSACPAVIATPHASRQHSSPQTQPDRHASNGRWTVFTVLAEGQGDARRGRAPDRTPARRRHDFYETTAQDLPSPRSEPCVPGQGRLFAPTLSSSLSWPRRRCSGRKPALRRRAPTGISVSRAVFGTWMGARSGQS